MIPSYSVRRDHIRWERRIVYVDTHRLVPFHLFRACILMLDHLLRFILRSSNYKLPMILGYAGHVNHYQSMFDTQTTKFLNQKSLIVLTMIPPKIHNFATLCGLPRSISNFKSEQFSNCHILMITVLLHTGVNSQNSALCSPVTRGYCSEA